MSLLKRFSDIAVNLISFFSLMLAIIILYFAFFGMKVSLVGIIICIIAFLAFVILNQSNNYRCKNIIFVSVLLIGIVLRVLPLLLGWEYICMNDLNDIGVHYFGALELAEGYLETNIVNYERIFPYLFPYTFFLSLCTRLSWGV